MKIHDNRFYIKQDKWESFLNEYPIFGFKHEGGFAYPDYVFKITDDGKKIQINISEPCVNVWDNEDKNKQREIWARQDTRGYGGKDVVAPYIGDLLYAGYVDE